MRTFAIFGTKLPDFSKFLVYPHGLGGVLSQCRNFANNGKGINFSRFCADVLHGRLLKPFYTYPFDGIFMV